MQSTDARHKENKVHCYLHIGLPWLPGGETQGILNQPDRREITRQLMEKIDTQALKAQQDYTMEAGLPLNTHFDCG